MSRTDELITKTAREVIALLNNSEVSPPEVLDAVLARIETVDPAVNAIPTLCVERAREAARHLKRSDESAAWLAGW